MTGFDIFKGYHFVGLHYQFKLPPLSCKLYEFMFYWQPGGVCIQLVLTLGWSYHVALYYCFSSIKQCIGLTIGDSEPLGGSSIIQIVMHG